MKKKIIRLVYLMLVVITGSLFFTSCLEDDNEDIVLKDLHLKVTGLPPLDDYHSYEGWIVVNGNIFSTGKFIVNEEGELSDSIFLVKADLLKEASDFIISIEPYPDPYYSPGNAHILAGSFVGGSAALSLAHEYALGTGFTSATGKYILATPTNGDNSNELSGIWWLDPAGPSKSLVLPTLPDGWIYEGWVVIDGTPVSTGKFSSAESPDNSDIYSATLDAPDFPGEDFLTNSPIGITFPVNLSGNNVIISVEPQPDNSNSPFDLKPLTGSIPDPASDHTLYDMVNNTNQIDISGEVTY